MLLQLLIICRVSHHNPNAIFVTLIHVCVGDIGELLTVLIQFNHDTLARQLQQVFAKLVNMIKEQMNSIWPPTSHNVVIN